MLDKILFTDILLVSALYFTPQTVEHMVYFLNIPYVRLCKVYYSQMPILTQLLLSRYAAIVRVV